MLQHAMEVHEGSESCLDLHGDRSVGECVTVGVPQCSGGCCQDRHRVSGGWEVCFD